MTPRTRALIWVLAIVAVVSLVPSFQLWRSNQELIRTATRLQTERLYDTLGSKGANIDSLHTFVSPQVIDRLRAADTSLGRVRSYRIERTLVQVFGTPSLSVVRCTRERGRTKDECYVDAIRPNATVNAWGYSEETQ